MTGSGPAQVTVLLNGNMALTPIDCSNSATGLAISCNNGQANIMCDCHSH